MKYIIYDPDSELYFSKMEGIYIEFIDWPEDAMLFNTYEEASDMCHKIAEMDKDIEHLIVEEA